MKEKVFIDEFYVCNINNDRKKYLFHILKKEFAKRIAKNELYDNQL